jgi:hypothetical protein
MLRYIFIPVFFVCIVAFTIFVDRLSPAQQSLNSFFKNSFNPESSQVPNKMKIINFI